MEVVSKKTSCSPVKRSRRWANSWQWSSNPGPPGQAIRAHLGHLNIIDDGPYGQFFHIASAEPAISPGSSCLSAFLGLQRFPEPVALAVHLEDVAVVGDPV